MLPVRRTNLHSTSWDGTCQRDGSRRTDVSAGRKSQTDFSEPLELWGLLWGLWLQIGITRYLSICLAGIRRTPVPQGFGTYRVIRSDTRENRCFSTHMRGVLFKSWCVGSLSHIRKIFFASQNRPTLLSKARRGITEVICGAGAGKRDESVSWTLRRHDEAVPYLPFLEMLESYVRGLATAKGARALLGEEGPELARLLPSSVA